MLSLKRFLSIYWVIARYRLDQLIEPKLLPWYGRVLFAIAPHRLKPIPSETLAARARMALEDLGPVFIKFGQALSTRRDLLPLDVADELAKLQDQVPPFDGDIATAIIETELKQPIDEAFSNFNKTPLASASIAQVHEATLLDGSEVVVKVVRPGIEKLIRKDIGLMYVLAKLAHRFLTDGKRLRPEELVTEYEITVLDELDMQREAANTSQLRRNFIESELLYVPEIYFDYTRPSLLVMERIHGIPIGDMAAMEAANINFKILAERGVEIFFTQVFRDNFFHADMHPGNIFVSRENPETPKYIGIDCAIIGSLSDFDRYYLASNLLAMFRRDYAAVATLHIESGWVPKTTRAGDFEGAIRSACEPIFDKPISEIGFAQILLYLFKVARRFDMEVQPSLVLLQKTLLNVEGLGRELYPHLNLWDTAMPFLEKWMAERYAPSNLLKQIQNNSPAWLEQLPKLPDLLLNKLQQPTADGEIHLLRKELKAANKRNRNKLIAATLVMAGIVVAQADFSAALNTNTLLGWGLAALATLFLLRD